MIKLQLLLACFFCWTMGRASAARSLLSHAKYKHRRTQMTNLPEDLDNAACQEENELLIRTSVLSDPLNDGSSLQFWIGEVELSGEQKNFPEYASCNAKGSSCDYTGWVDQLQGACQLFGGKVWEISGTETCPSYEDTNSTLQQEYTHTNYPICIGRSCNITLRLMEYEAQSGEECYNKSYEFSLVETTTDFGNKCQDDMLALMQKGPEDEFWGIGSPEYVWEERQGRWVDEACNDDSLLFNFSCDFAPSHEEIKALCEDQGGYLYSFSDEVHNVRIYTVNNSVVEWTERGVNVPLCIASSCDGPKYIQDFIFSYYNLHLNGTFLAANWTSVNLYKPGGIVVVSDITEEEEGSREPDDGEISAEVAGADDSESASPALSRHHFILMAVVAVVLGLGVL